MYAYAAASRRAWRINSCMTLARYRALRRAHARRCVMAYDAGSGMAQQTWRSKMAAKTGNRRRVMAAAEYSGNRAMANVTTLSSISRAKTRI